MVHSTRIVLSNWQPRVHWATSLNLVCLRLSKFPCFDCRLGLRFLQRLNIWGSADLTDTGPRTCFCLNIDHNSPYTNWSIQKSIFWNLFQKYWKTANDPKKRIVYFETGWNATQNNIRVFLTHWEWPPLN